MKIKIKRKQKILKKIPKLDKPEKPVTIKNFGEIPALKNLQNFLREYNNSKDFSSKYLLVSRNYSSLFDEKIPNKPFELIRLKVAYELLRRDFEFENIIPPERTRRNIQAALEFNIQKFDNGQKQLIKIKLNQEDEEMVKVKKKVSSSSEKPIRKAVGHLYLDIFSKQAQNKLSDAQIASQIGKETGVEPSLKNVASYRCMYNKGTIKGQKAVPKISVKAFNVNAEKKVSSLKPKTVVKKSALKVAKKPSKIIKEKVSSPKKKLKK